MSAVGALDEATVGNVRLHAAVVEAGLTYAELAERLGVDPKTVDRWVNEPGRRPYARHAAAVARVLGVDVFELWPAKRRPAASATAVPGSAQQAREALSRAEQLDVTAASTVELALHLGALQASLRSVLETFAQVEVAR